MTAIDLLKKIAEKANEFKIAHSEIQNDTEQSPLAKLVANQLRSELFALLDELENHVLPSNTQTDEKKDC